MNTIGREQLHAYLDDALSDAETAWLERELRVNEPLRKQLRDVIQERDRGEHSIGAIWRRERLTCPTRAELGSFLLEVLEADHQSYVDFHLKVVACPYCLANLQDLKDHQQAMGDSTQTRRRRYYQSSAGLLQKKG